MLSFFKWKLKRFERSAMVKWTCMKFFVHHQHLLAEFIFCACLWYYSIFLRLISMDFMFICWHFIKFISVLLCLTKQNWVFSVYIGYFVKMCSMRISIEAKPACCYALLSQYITLVVAFSAMGLAWTWVSTLFCFLVEVQSMSPYLDKLVNCLLNRCTVASKRHCLFC